MTQFETATFAAGCFWGVEAYFRRVKGVIETTVGYIGGHSRHPTYEQVCTGTTGHAEAVMIIFDPAIISYEKLIRHFWKVHDPTTKGHQGNDVGTQYRSVIFYHSPAQLRIATKAKEEFKRKSPPRLPVTTQIVPAGEFFKAEQLHQDYLENHPSGYCHMDLSKIDKDE